MAFGQTCFDYAEAFRSTARNFRGVSCDLAPARCVFLTIEFALSARRHATVKVEIDQSRFSSSGSSRVSNERLDENVEDVSQPTARGIVVGRVRK